MKDTNGADIESDYTAMGARWYLPEIGRFLSCDPLWAAFPSSSPYVYANDNPMSFKDPSGMAPEKEENISGKGGKSSGNRTMSNLTTDQAVAEEINNMLASWGNVKISAVEGGFVSGCNWLGADNQSYKGVYDAFYGGMYASARLAQSYGFACFAGAVGSANGVNVIIINEILGNESNNGKTHELRELAKNEGIILHPISQEYANYIVQRVNDLYKQISDPDSRAYAPNVANFMTLYTLYIGIADNMSDAYGKTLSTGVPRGIFINRDLCDGKTTKEGQWFGSVLFHELIHGMSYDEFGAYSAQYAAGFISRSSLLNRSHYDGMIFLTPGKDSFEKIRDSSPNDIIKGYFNNYQNKGTNQQDLLNSYWNYGRQIIGN